MKIILGTANFNLNYGFQHNKIKKKEIKYIKKYIKDKINTIDSAESYKHKKEFSLHKNIKVNSKVSNFNTQSQNDCNILLKKKIKTILKSHNIKKIHTLFLHRPEEILKNKTGDFLINSLLQSKRQNLISKIGYSVYNPFEAIQLIKKHRPDIIQIPFNVFDRRLIDPKFLNLLEKDRIKIQIRSIFLQGLLTNKNAYNLKKFCKFKLQLKEWHSWVEKNGLVPEEAAINFVLNYKKKFDSILLGIDNFEQLKKNMYYIKNRKKIAFPKFKIIKKNILDPRKW